MPADSVLGSLLAYRVVYYLLPFAVVGIVSGVYQMRRGTENRPAENAAPSTVAAGSP